MIFCLCNDAGFLSRLVNLLVNSFAAILIERK